MLVDQRREPGNVLRFDLHAFSPQLVESGLHIHGIPQHDRIDDQSQSPQLIFLPLTIPLPEFTPLPMKDCPCHTVTAFASVELGENASSIVLALR